MATKDARVVAEKIAGESASVEPLKVAAEAGFEYVRKVRGSRVAPLAEDLSGLTRFHEGFPLGPCDAGDVIRMLSEMGGAATMASTGGRYFGYVIGGAVPAAMAANWLVGAWD